MRRSLVKPTRDDHGDDTMTRGCGPTGGAPPPAARAAETKRATRPFQTSAPCSARTLVALALPLLLPLLPHVSGVHPESAEEQRWRPAVAWEGQEGIGRRCWISDNGRRRCYANVFFFGVEKCGTTTLASWMTHHPALRWVSNFGHFGQRGFEAHVLNRPSAVIRPSLLPTSKERYAALAPEAEEEDRVIDYTPHYAVVPEVPYRIRRIYGNSSFDGDTKYFVLLREPVARAISAWEFRFNMYSLSKNADPKKVTGESRPLEQAVREGTEDVDALLGCLDNNQPRPSLPWELLGLESIRELDLNKCHTQKYWGYNDHLLRHHVGNGMYALHLERWFAVVGRQNVKVLFLEELDDDPVKTLEDLFEFIGLGLIDRSGRKGLASREAWERIVGTRSNITADRRKAALGPQVTSALVQRMRDFFAPHNARLEELLDRRLPDSWSMPVAS